MNKNTKLLVGLGFVGIAGYLGYKYLKNKQLSAQQTIPDTSGSDTGVVSDAEIVTDAGVPIQTSGAGTQTSVTTGAGAGTAGSGTGAGVTQPSTQTAVNVNAPYATLFYEDGQTQIIKGQTTTTTTTTTISPIKGGSSGTLMSAGQFTSTGSGTTTSPTTNWQATISRWVKGLTKAVTLTQQQTAYATSPSTSGGGGTLTQTTNPLDREDEYGYGFEPDSQINDTTSIYADTELG